MCVDHNLIHLSVLHNELPILASIRLSMLPQTDSLTTAVTVADPVNRQAQDKDQVVDGDAS